MLNNYIKYIEVLKMYGITDPEVIKSDGVFSKSNTYAGNNKWISYNGAVIDDGVVYIETEKTEVLVDKKLSYNENKTVYVRNIDNLDFKYQTTKKDEKGLNNQLKAVLISLVKGIDTSYIMEELNITELKLFNEKVK